MTAATLVPAHTGPAGPSPSRGRPAIRRARDRELLTRGDLMQPLLVVEQAADDELLPGTVTLASLPGFVRDLAGLGMAGVKVFVEGHDRDPKASGALAPDNRMIRAIREIKLAAPELMVCTEVCGCSWTGHGECVLLDGAGDVDVDRTWELLCDMAVMHADAGADQVSPTAMLDGSVTRVRDMLDDHGHRNVSLNPNIAMHTSLFGPFKARMSTDPARGHRRGMQIEPARASHDAMRQAQNWALERADAVTVQPAMTNQDVITRLAAAGYLGMDLTAYSTSGEWALVLRHAPDGFLLGYHRGLKRAGADNILTFAAARLAALLAH